MTKRSSYSPGTKNKMTGQFILVYIIVLLTYIGLTLPYTIFPQLFVGNNTSHSKMILYSLLVSIYPLGQMVGMIIFGNLSDLCGRKNILLLTLAGAIVTFILSGITLASHSYYLLNFIRFFCGMFEGNYTIALAIVNDLTSQTGGKKKWFGRMNIAVTIGFILGPFLGTIFSDSRNISWFNDSTPFYLAAIINVVTFIAIKIYFKETSRNSIKTKYSLNLGKYLKDYAFKINQCFQNRGLTRLILIYLFITVAVDILQIFMPVYMVHYWNAAPEMMVIALLSLSLGRILGNGYLINIVDSIFKTPLNTVIVSVIVFIPIIISLICVHEITGYVALLFVVGLCIAFCITNLAVFISNISDIQTIGFVLSITQGLRIFMEAVFCNIAALSCYISFNMPFIMSVGFSLVALLGILICAKRYTPASLNVTS